MNKLLAGSFWENYGLLIILVVALIAMFAWNFYRQKKYQKQEEQMMQEIKVGTKVKTYAGVYGTIVGIYESTEGKVAVLSLDGKTTVEVDFRSIYGVDNKKKIEEVSEEPATETVEPEVKEEAVEEPVSEPSKEEAEPEKTEKKTSKKSKKAE